MNKVTSGALWEKQTSKGDTYYSGSVEIDGAKYQVSFFKNNYKKEDKHPDRHFGVHGMQQPNGFNLGPTWTISSPFGGPKLSYLPPLEATICIGKIGKSIDRDRLHLGR